MADREVASAGTAEQSGDDHGGRKRPPMRVVTKGWWILREKSVPVEELEREDREKARKSA